MVQTDSILIGLVGPTAVGKSELAFSLAEKFGTYILSADSMQIYKGFDIGTAKPTAEEQRRVPHRLIDIVEPESYFSSMDYAERCDEEIAICRRENRIPLIVGGTGFYFDSFLYKTDFEGSVDENVRKELNAVYEEKGGDYIYEMLKKIDPESAADIHPNNVKRVMRALEIYMTTGRKKSSGSGKQRKKRYENAVIFELARERKDLYSRIDGRVDKMISDGLITEVEGLLRKIGKDCQSMQGIGYKEFVPYLNGECSLSEALDNVKLNTRHYAKRQLSYFKRMNTILLDAYLPTKELIEIIEKTIENAKAADNRIG